MSRECWIPADLHEDLAPLVEEWGRRAAEAADAKARRVALSLDAENRDRRKALTEAYADGGAHAAAELPEPLTPEQQRAWHAKADAHVAAATAALYAFNEQAVAAIREHAEEIKADLSEHREQAEAESDEAERVLAEAQARANKAHRDASYQQRTEQWIDALCEGRAVLYDRPTRFRLTRRPAAVPTLTEIYNRGSTMPPAPVGLIGVGAHATAEEIEQARAANAAATKAGAEQVARQQDATAERIHGPRRVTTEEAA